MSLPATKTHRITQYHFFVLKREVKTTIYNFTGGYVPEYLELTHCPSEENIWHIAHVNQSVIKNLDLGAVSSVVG